MAKHRVPLNWLTVAVVAAALTAGCERRRDALSEPSSMPGANYGPPVPGVYNPPPPALQPRGGGPLTTLEQGLTALSAARCEREARCGHIGAGQRYGSREACAREVRAHHGDDLNAESCPAGLDASELRECLREARDEDCANPLDSLGRVAACRPSDLCRHR